MAKSIFSKDDVRFSALMEAINKFQDDQVGNIDKFLVKRITLSLDSSKRNPCSGQNCKAGYHPEIYINPVTGEVSCRCVKN